MPSKGHRAASKQAKLRHKRRHGRGGAQQFDAGPTESETVAVKPVREAETEVDAESEPQLTPKPAAVALRRLQPARRAKQPTTGEATAPRYLYLGTELRRIGVITVIIILLLAAASLVLGD